MTRREQNIGADGELRAENVLRSLGVEMVEKIGTPVRLIPHHHLPGYYRVIWGERVSGDRRGIMPDGRSVLAETKTILDRNLRYSDLREHQPGCLQLHADNHGLSLLIWVHSTGIYIMEWPIEGFIKGSSIEPEKASELDEQARKLISEYSRK